MKYAEDTRVNASKSMNEVDRVLMRYGAVQFATGRDDERGVAIISFKIKGLLYKIEVPIPQRKDFIFTEHNRKRTEQQINQAWEQAYRQRWRAMVLVIKAKLEAAESGISTIEKEFLMHIMLPDGKTLSDWIIPQLENAVASGDMPKQLPMFSGPSGKRES